MMTMTSRRDARAAIASPAGEIAVVERAWLQEAEHRYQAYLRGEDQAIPAEEAFAELRAEDR